MIRIRSKLGVIMKRIKLLLIFTALSKTGIFAQYFANYRGLDRAETRIQRQELRDFQYEIEQFSYALITNNLRDSRYAKRQILRTMEREIEQTRRALHRFSNTYGETYSKRVEPDWRTPRMHSRGNGVRQQRNNGINHYAEVIHQLEKQERLYYRFSELRLINNRRQIINENEHRRIMYRFEETMRDQLLDERTERTNPRRGR